MLSVILKVEEPVFIVSYEIPVLKILLDTRGFHKQASENIGISDYYTSLFSKNKEESVSVFDRVLASISKGKNELVHLTDQFDRICSFKRTPVDPVRIRDHLLLVSNNYCDLSYFSQDYVGDSRVA